MTHDEVKQKVLDYIRKNDAVSYVEVERVFDETGLEWKGNLDICSPVNENVVLWSGWNEVAARLMNELKREELIHQEPAGPLIYLIDGKTLTLPRVTSARQYKTPHWLPLVFRPGPFPE